MATTTTDLQAKFILPRLNAAAPLVMQGGLPAATFVRWWNQAMQAIEAQVTAINASVSAIQQAINAANTATAAAATAETAANTAQTSSVAAATAAASVTTSNNISASYIQGGSGVLSATDAGASVTITIATHNRILGDGTIISVTGGTLTGQAYSASLYVYYDDPTLAGGAVTYHSATTISVAGYSTTNPFRFLVGAVVTPAALGPPSDGNVAQPPNLRLPGGFNFL